MSFLYVVTNGCTIGIEGGNFVISYPDDHTDEIPKQTVQGISIFGNSQMTTQCMRFCLGNKINVGFFSQNGTYHGKLTSTDSVNIVRLRKQFELTGNEEFCVRMAKRFVKAKIHNQIVVAKRYARKGNYNFEDKFRMMEIAASKVNFLKGIPQIMGFEGMASKMYFQILSGVIKKDFVSVARSRRPPRDPFNAMLSLGYSLLTKELCGEIENCGLCSYAGFMHKDRNKHPALASDMLEEWRPVIVDSVVMSLIQGNEILASDFEYQGKTCLLNEHGLKTFLLKMEKRMNNEMNYLKYINKPVTFREALWHQAECMARVVDTKEISSYSPVWIR